MGIFRKEAKASKVGRLMEVQTLGRPAWTPRDYASLAREGYAKNPIVFRCVRMIAEAAASAPWLLYDGSSEIDDHALLGLLARPNPSQSGAALLESIYGHLLVAGNAYIEAVVLRDEGQLNDEQFERLKAELEDGYQGARNAGRPLLLEGGLDWKTMAMSPRDMDFIEAKNQAAREIALAFGVPPMLLGIPGDNTYANYREASSIAARIVALLDGATLPLTGFKLDALRVRDTSVAASRDRRAYRVRLRFEATTEIN